jgi:hypothetical protein
MSPAPVLDALSAAAAVQPQAAADLPLRADLRRGAGEAVERLLQDEAIEQHGEVLIAQRPRRRRMERVGGCREHTIGSAWRQHRDPTVGGPVDACGDARVGARSHLVLVRRVERTHLQLHHDAVAGGELGAPPLPQHTEVGIRPLGSWQDRGDIGQFPSSGLVALVRCQSCVPTSSVN